MTQLVLLRHGESISNRDRCFTGWSDAPLTPLGEREAEQAGCLLKKAGHKFDICFTSELRRANDTLHIVLSTMGQDEPVVQRSWRLNERHYGLWKESIAGRQSGNTASALFSVLNSALMPRRLRSILPTSVPPEPVVLRKH